MKKIIFLFAPLCAMLMVGCVKDEPEEDDLVFEIFAESLSSDNSSKLAVRDEKTYWVDGERIWVNGGTYQVYIDDPEGTTAKAERPDKNVSTYNRKFKSSNFTCLIYPFSANVNWNYYGEKVNNVYKGTRVYTIAVPSSYDYKESGAASGRKQILEGLPMVAYVGSDKPSSVTFKHITAALTVRVTNNTPDDYIVVEKIELINDKYQLCGKVQVTLSDTNPDIKTEGGAHAIPYYQNTPDTVTLNFNGNSPKIYTSKDFQIPILPVGSEDSKFTIKVYAKSYKSTLKGPVAHCLVDPYVVSFTDPYVRSTNVGNKSIGRACLGYAPITFNTSYELLTADNTPTTITLKDGTTVTKYFYKISNKQELKMLSDILDSRDLTLQGSPDAGPFQNGNYIVLNDINMDGEVLTPLHYYNEGGTERVYFYGNGKTISNFKVSSVNENEPNCCGFFGRSAGDNITIEKLTLENATYEIAHMKKKIIDYDGNYCSSVGGIYSCVDHKGIVIEDCHVKNVTMGATNGVQSDTNSQTDFYAGGIVGAVFSSVTIRNCSVGTVTVDNTNDASSGTLVDQFGAAVARIDVGDGSGSNTYGTIMGQSGKTPEDVPAVIIENFTYDQGGTPLVIGSGLFNVRYGGLVGNITRGGRLIMNNCIVKHNIRIDALPSDKMFIGGLIGCLKIGKTMGVFLNANCIVSGEINNQVSGFTGHTSGFRIGKYYSIGEGSSSSLLLKLSGSSSTCTNSLSVTGHTPTPEFYENNQSFSY